MKREFAVQVGDALRGNDRAQMRWLKGCHIPLRHAQIRNTYQPDSPGTPPLRRRPFDQVVVIFRVLLPEHSRVSFRLVLATNIRLKHCVALLHPIGGIR
jgi:hypothetical protein